MLPLILASFGGLVLLYVIWTFNRMVRLRKQADNAWSDIDVQLKRRWDLVPALVETVKGYSRHEASTLEGVVSARKEAKRAESPAERGAKESTLTGAVHSIFALVEAYPDLKASESYQELHRSLVEIENNVQYARRYYNAVVRDLNTLLATFPPNLVAGPFGFREREFFELEDTSERQAPRVQP
jgi:LemA protein